MNKQQQLTRGAIRNGVIAAIVVLVFGAIYYGTDMLAASAAEAKTKAEEAYNAENTKMSGYSSQIERSGDAQKRFILLQQGRDNVDFTADIDGFSALIAAMKDQYRFSRALKVTVTNDKPSDKTELQTFDYAITVRPAMEITLEAISDVHVFSFLQDLQRRAAGIIIIDRLEIKRKADIDAGSIAEMKTGAAPYQVEAHIVFDWIGVSRKEPKSAKASAPNTSAAPNAMPGVSQ